MLTNMCTRAEAGVSSGRGEDASALKGRDEDVYIWLMCKKSSVKTVPLVSPSPFYKDVLFMFYPDCGGEL